MSVKSKFDVGEKVWAITPIDKVIRCSMCGAPERKFGEYVVREGVLIEGVQLSLTKSGVLYMVSDKADGLRYTKEDNLFSTQIEAQEECNKRNKSLKLK